MNNGNEAKSSSLSELFYSLLKNWIIILLALVLFIGAGVLYSKMQKPYYTVQEKAFYTAKSIISEDVNSSDHVNAARKYKDIMVGFSDVPYVINRANYMYGLLLNERQTNPDISVDEFLNNYRKNSRVKYDYNDLLNVIGSELDTFFTKTTIVNKKEQTKNYIFRGNLLNVFDDRIILENNGLLVEVPKDDYGYSYLTGTYRPEYSFTELSLIEKGTKIKVFAYDSQDAGVSVECTGTYQGVEDGACVVNVDGYQRKFAKENFKKAILILPSYISASNLSVSYSEGNTSDEESFIFNVNYTDEDVLVASEKVKIIISAIDTEAKTYSFNPTTPIEAQLKFFKVVEVSLTDAGRSGVSSSVSHFRNVFIFALAGLVVGVVIAYLKEILDKTIKSKEQLEAITDTVILSVIPVEEGK